MLHRDDPAGLIVLAQPAHAWISGQLARAWGNAAFGEVVPCEEVSLAAEQHDIGWTAWEQNPELNPVTGRPYTFMELPRQTHIDIWSASAQAALPLGRYVALLVAAHGAGLYERNQHWKRETPENIRRVESFLAQSQAFTAGMAALLQSDQACASNASPAKLARNQRLIAVWDFFSLVLCMGLKDEQKIKQVPAAAEPATLTVKAADAAATEFQVDPWPFARDSLALVCEGRRLPATFLRQEEMRAALFAAPWVRLELRLTSRGA